MKCAAVVLCNRRNSLSAVDYVSVTDALLSGGVTLSEVAILPYDDETALTSALVRLGDAGGLFVICSRVLFEAALQGVSLVAGKAPEGELFETEKTLYAVLTADMDGVNAVKERVIPALDRLRGQSFFRTVLCTVGASGEELRSAMEHARGAGEGYFIHCTERYGAARLEVVYDRTTPKYTVDEAVRILMDELGEYVYATEEKTIAERLVEALKVRRMTVSTAESFTGGGVGRAIVRVPGASAVYFEGLNTYHPKSKMARLGVTPFTVDHRGTVSDETAYEMAAGLIVEGNCDLAIATTGVAGPDADEKGNPPGLCYLAVGTREKVEIFRYQIAGDRETVTETAINLALFLAYRSLK